MRCAPLGEEAADAARGWLGTPYVHQGAQRGAGTDCLGLIRGVWAELLGPLPAVIPPYTRDWGEIAGQEPLWRAALRHLRAKPRDLAAQGDVLLFRMRAWGPAKHLGIQSGEERFIHAYEGHGVIESPLSRPWARRLVARFEFPERRQ